MTETNRIEYKAQLTKDLDLEKEVVAFLNYREGGVIYIGIDKTGKVTEISDADGDMLKIKDRIKHNIAPSAMGLFDVVVEERDGKDIIKIIVASGSEKPYFKKKYGMTEKGCFIRIGTAAEPMPQQMIDRLFATRTRNSLSKIVSNRQDLTFEQLKIYYEAKKLKLTGKFAQNLELLTKEGQFNYVAYLLADENGTSIKVAKYSGINRVDLVESNEYGYCSLIKATKSVLDKLDLENRTATKITSKERIDTRLWDGIALREAVINAIIHNDYTREIPPKFEIFSDRLEITSYGGLFEGMTREDFFEGLSLPRNKELMRVYKDLDMVEQLGSGVPRILQAYDKSCFKFSDNFTRMTLPNSVVEDNQDADQREIMEIDAPDLQELRKEFGLISERTQKNHEENIQFLRGIYGAFTGHLRGNYGITAEKLRNEFGERLIFILELMLIDEYATRQNFADILGASLSTIEKNIKILRDKNIIERRGSDKTGYWQILNQN